MTDHLLEIKDLSQQCIETAIELLPRYDECATEREREKRVQQMLINLRAIQNELADFKREAKP